MGTELKTTKQKVYSIVFTLLLFAATGLFIAKCTGQTPKGIKPSRKLLEADLFGMKFNFEGHELQFPFTIKEFRKATGWEVQHTNGKDVDEWSKCCCCVGVDSVFGLFAAA